MGEAVSATPKKQRRTKKIKYIDYTLLLMIICLLAFGLVMLYSTSAYNATLKTGDSAYYLKSRREPQLWDLLPWRPVSKLAITSLNPLPELGT